MELQSESRKVEVPQGATYWQETVTEEHREKSQPAWAHEAMLKSKLLAIARVKHFFMIGTFQLPRARAWLCCF
jgi:hypothetical protein